MPFRLFLMFGCFVMAASASLAQGTAQGAPHVLILGDSQLSFGAGVAFVELMEDMAGSCGLDPVTTTGVIGVRSSALTSWSGQSTRAKGPICDIDPTWRVNAGVYGSLALSGNPWVQIGQGPQFQFCRPGISPLAAVFDEGYYQPRLLIMFLMGNAAERWANRPEAALSDVGAMMADLPMDQPCIFMTSAPPYRESSVTLRQRAQDNLAEAFAALGSHCSFVAGFTAETINENMGNPANFRRNSAGNVRDPFHPTEAAAHRFLGLQRASLCQAMQQQLDTLQNRALPARNQQAVTLLTYQ